jgi:hypothetical protein
MSFNSFKLSMLAMVSSLLLLAGCEAQMFGMPETQFHQLTPFEKQQVIDSYNRRQEIKQQNQPMESLIGVLGTAVEQGNEKHH